MLAAMLQAAGRRVDRYISPHLVQLQRAHPARRRADRRGAAGRVPRRAARRANAGAPITFFEITTAAAFLAFAEAPADWVLLETGLGGRLDATNVVAQAAADCLITPISMDHESYLGDTLAQIAFEKAGILKPGVPAVRRAAAAGGAGGDRGARRRGRGAAPGARPRLAGPADAGRLVVETARERGSICRARALAGVHQIDNAGPRRGGGAGSWPRPRLDRAAIAQGLQRGALAGAAAAADAWPAGRAAARGRPRSGSMAATTRPRARCWPRA